MKRLVLIDGMAVIHRAYHALPPMSTREGQPTNAVYGFTTMLLRIIEELKPDYLAVAFDLPQPTFRRELYLAYQANRPYPHDDLASQFDLVRDLVQSSKIPLLAVPGYEADDVIGTLSRQCIVNSKQYIGKNKVGEVIVVTGDRDMMQLVNKKVKLYMPVRGLSEAKVVDEEHVKDYWGVSPKQVIDLKALIGDSSDNYPGVPGIGPKTAGALLNKFKTLGGIYEALSKQYTVKSTQEISEKIKEKLVGGQESALLSQKLATIVCDVPLKFDLKEASVSDFSKNEGFIKKLQEFQFKSLLARLGVGFSKKEGRAHSKMNGNGQMGLI